MARNWPGFTVPLTLSMIILGSVIVDFGLHLAFTGMAVIVMSIHVS